MSYVFSFNVSPEFDKLQILDLMELKFKNKAEYINFLNNKDVLALADDPLLLPKNENNLIGYSIALGNSIPHVFLDIVIEFSLLYGVKELESYTNENLSSVFINGYKYFIDFEPDFSHKTEHPHFINYDETKTLIFSPNYPYNSFDKTKKIVNFLILQNLLLKNNYQIINNNFNHI